MEIVNVYEETLSHYSMKLSHIEDELASALKGIQELEVLVSDGWKGKAGSEMLLVAQELRQAVAAPKADIDSVRTNLTQLGVVIEEEIRTLEQEAALAALQQEC